jgi:NitT/TauT family transport system substrate-binding protein
MVTTENRSDYPNTTVSDDRKANMSSKSGIGSPSRRKARLMAAATALLVVALALVAAGCGSSGGGSTGAAANIGSGGSGGSSSSSSGIAGKRFTLMVQSTPDVSKVVEAHAIEILKQEGVDATLKFNASTPNVAIAQLMGGDIDAYGEAVTGGLGAALQGVPLVDFALMQPRQDYVMLGKSPISTLGQLKGKSVGIEDTTGVNYAQLILALQHGNLSVNDVHVVQAGGQTTRLAALVAGRVDATMLSHSAQIELQSKGYNTLFDYTKQTNLYDDNAFSTKKWLSANPQMAVAFNKALLESYVWFDNPANLNAVVSEALKLEPGGNQQQTVAFFKELRSADAYPENSTLSLSALNSEQNLFAKYKIVSGTMPVAQWATTKYAQQALAQVKGGGATASTTGSK